MAVKTFTIGQKALASQLNALNDDNISYTYNSDGTIHTVVDNIASVTYTYAYNSNATVHTITDGTNTWTVNYTNGKISSIVRS